MPETADEIDVQRTVSAVWSHRALIWTAIVSLAAGASAVYGFGVSSEKKRSEQADLVKRVDSVEKDAAEFKSWQKEVTKQMSEVTGALRELVGEMKGRTARERGAE